MKTQENSEIYFQVEENNDEENLIYYYQNFRSEIELENYLSELSKIIQKKAASICFTRNKNSIDIIIKPEIKNMYFSDLFKKYRFTEIHCQTMVDKKRKIDYEKLYKAKNIEYEKLKKENESIQQKLEEYESLVNKINKKNFLELKIEKFSFAIRINQEKEKKEIKDELNRYKAKNFKNKKRNIEIENIRKKMKNKPKEKLTDEEKEKIINEEDDAKIKIILRSSILGQ